MIPPRVRSALAGVIVTSYAVALAAAFVAVALRLGGR